jgi:hypothetical protein
MKLNIQSLARNPAIENYDEPFPSVLYFSKLFLYNQSYHNFIFCYFPSGFPPLKQYYSIHMTSSS